MNRFILLIFFFIQAFLLFSQNDAESTIYLKNGGVVKGVIVETTGSNSVMIKTSGGETYYYADNEIERITKNAKPEEEPLHVTQQKGYRGSLKAGYCFSFGNESEYFNRIKFDFVNAYQIAPFFSVGVGVGVRIYHQIEPSEFLLPVFGELHFGFLQKKVGPYFSIGMGYVFDLSNDENFYFQKNGILIQPEVGCNFVISEIATLFIGIGGDLVHNKKSTPNNAFSLNLGVRF